MASPPEPGKSPFLVRGSLRIDDGSHSFEISGADEELVVRFPGFKTLLQGWRSSRTFAKHLPTGVSSGAGPSLPALPPIRVLCANRTLAILKAKKGRYRLGLTLWKFLTGQS
ncbi:MAG: hypothetical protein AAF555_06870 [Verrucomicrobiota bacterium]